MFIEISPDEAGGKSNRGLHFTRLTGSTIADACRLKGFQRPQEMPEMTTYMAAFFGNDAAEDALGGIACRRKPACIPCEGVHHAKQDTCHRRDRRRYCHAGRSPGIVRGSSSVIVNDDADGIAVDQRPAFREYIVRERVPTYTIPERVIVGGVLPEAGITYYDVPQTFGGTPYRYTVVNGRTVLVEPRSRRIVQVVE
jgi:hypothetical protein